MNIDFVLMRQEIEEKSKTANLFNNKKWSIYDVGLNGDSKLSLLVSKLRPQTWSNCNLKTHNWKKRLLFVFS